MRKLFKILGATILVLALLLAVSPFLFKGKLEDLLKQTINANLNAEVTWEQLDLSLLSCFPKASVKIENFMVINNAPFAGDTLAEGRALYINMGVRQLFKKATDNPIKVDALQLDDAVIQLKVDADGNANYNISKKEESAFAKSNSRDSQPEGERSGKAEETTERANSSPFRFDLKHYELNNSTIAYSDASSQTELMLSNITHEGNGDFSALSSTLSTATEGQVSLQIEGTKYLSSQDIGLEATINLDLENQKYTFQENTGHINGLPLTFDGFVQLVEEGTLMDLTFETPNSDFKNFLAVIPKAYAASLDGVDTSGDFRVSGLLKGTSSETTIPEMDIAIESNNASFKYPDLPKRMNNININARVVNKTGIASDTYVAINTLNFKIDEDVFSADGTLRNLTTNMLVNLALKGTLDLANIEKVYPLDLKDPLSGIVQADFSTAFDMNAIERQQYQNIESTGEARLTDFQYTTEKLPKPISISNAAVAFNPAGIELTSFQGTTGRTDINATGTIQNLIPFVMSKEDLKGRFHVQSQIFDLNDFSSEADEVAQKTSKTATATSETENGIQIPNFLDAALDFTAQTVIYDDLTLSDVSGSVAIQDEQAELTKLKSELLGGSAGLSGKVSTKNNLPVFDVNLDLSEIDIDQSFKNLPMLKRLAPVAKALQGGLTTKIKLQGSLDENLSPVLSTIEGDAFAQVLTAQITPEDMPLLTSLDNALEFIDFSTLDLSNLQTQVKFKDGQVQVQPFDFMAEGITVSVSGGHSFENTMNYQLSLDVPAQYLGNEVSGLLSKLTTKEKENLSVAIPVSLSGNFTQPKLNLNTQAAITDLTNQIIEIQKQRLQDQATDMLGDVLGDILSSNKPKDSTATGTNSNGNTQAEDAIKDIAGGLLGGLLGKKKKKETKETKKDSTEN